MAENAGRTIHRRSKLTPIGLCKEKKNLHSYVLHAIITRSELLIRLIQFHYLIEKLSIETYDEYLCRHLQEAEKDWH